MYKRQRQHKLVHTSLKLHQIMTPLRQFSDSSRGLAACGVKSKMPFNLADAMRCDAASRREQRESMDWMSKNCGCGIADCGFGGHCGQLRMR